MTQRGIRVLGCHTSIWWWHIGGLGFRDVTLAYDDDITGNIGYKDVTLAYDDNTKGIIGSKDVTLAYDDDT